MASNKQKLKESVVNVLMEPYLKEMLVKLSTDSGIKMSQMMREMIESRYRMRFNNEPACVDCNACRCPQMHSIQRAEKMAGADLLDQYHGE